MDFDSFLHFFFFSLGLLPKYFTDCCDLHQPIIFLFPWQITDLAKVLRGKTIEAPPKMPDRSLIPALLELWRWQRNAGERRKKFSHNKHLKRSGARELCSGQKRRSHYDFLLQSPRGKLCFVGQDEWLFTLKMRKILSPFLIDVANVSLANGHWRQKKSRANKWRLMQNAATEKQEVS